MKIIFFWVNDFLNIKNQSLNFGSKFNYSLEKIGFNLKIKRTENQDYIEEFFNSKDTGIVNVSALVGDNGSGKSNFLDALKKGLSSDRDWFDYLILFEDQVGNIFYKLKEPQFNILDSIQNKEKQEKEFKVDSEGFSMKNLKDKEFFSETIFYSPTLDYRIYPITHDNNKWIDISTDFLIYKIPETEKFAKNEISQIDIFRYFEIKCQLDVLRNTQIKNELERHIAVPNRIRVISTGVYISDDIGSSDFRNIPFEIREIYKQIMKISYNELIALDKGKEKTKTQKNEQQKVFGFLLEHILTSFIKHLNLTNHFYQNLNYPLEKGKFQNKTTKENLIIFFEGFKQLGYENNVKDFIEFIETLMFKNNCEFHDAKSVSFEYGIDDFEKLFELNNHYLRFLKQFTFGSTPISFIDFSWRSLSTGEKAYFNLFSKFFYSRELIIEKLNQQKTLDTIYILIDEGELGFHLSWQKNYISTLLSFIPIAFEIEGKKNNIQIIFTSHSPMSLSDIPRYNVSYIRKNTKKYAEILKDGERPNKTFGANVHTLLINSFFLDDGLIGDFSKRRINEIIELINKGSDETSNEIKNWIKGHLNIIDEPILKAKLEEMFYEKFKDQGELKRLEELKEEIEIKINNLKK